jgi:hypothetical protein
MRSKNPSNERIPRAAAGASGRARGSAQAVILDFVQHRIEAFNREQGGGASVRKDRNGYTLVREDTGVPIARLRPKDNKGSFEVFYFSPDTDRWRSAGLIGASAMSLAEALDFIASDPMDCFWR